MKRHFNIIAFSLICFFFAFTNISAGSCDDAKRDSEKIDAYYKIKNENKDIHLNIIFNGLTENTYLKIEYNGKNEKFEYTKENNGSIGFKYSNIYEKVKFTFKVYSNTIDCKDTLLNTIEITTPKYNKYYDTTICNDNPKFEYCIPFLGVKTKKNDNTQNDITGTITNEIELTEDEFNSYFGAYLIEKEKLESNILYRIWNYIKVYYLYALIPLVLVSVIYIIVIIKLKKDVKK